MLEIRLAEGLAMAMMDCIMTQFIDSIEWTAVDDGTLAWRYPMAGNEIQHGASLTVRENVRVGRAAVNRWTRRIDRRADSEAVARTLEFLGHTVLRRNHSLKVMLRLLFST